jgi:hypothetical protein
VRIILAPNREVFQEDGVSGVIRIDVVYVLERMLSGNSNCMKYVARIG